MDCMAWLIDIWTGLLELVWVSGYHLEKHIIKHINNIEEI